MNFLDRFMILRTCPEGEQVFDMLGGRDLLSLMINARGFKSFKYKEGDTPICCCSFLYGDKRNLLEVKISKKRGHTLLQVTSWEPRWLRQKIKLFSSISLYPGTITECTLIYQVEVATSMSLSF